MSLCVGWKVACLLRGRHVAPIDEGLPVVRRFPGEGAVVGRHLAEVSVGDLVEGAGLDDGDGAGLLLYQPGGESEPGVAATDHYIVKRPAVPRHTEGRSKECSCPDALVGRCSLGERRRREKANTQFERT